MVFSLIVFHCDRISSKLHYNCRLGARGDRQKGPHFALVHDIFENFESFSENRMYLLKP